MAVAFLHNFAATIKLATKMPQRIKLDTQSTFLIAIICGLLLLLIDTCETKRVIEGEHVMQRDKIQQFTLRAKVDSASLYAQDLELVKSEDDIQVLKNELAKMKAENVQVAIGAKTKGVYKTSVKLDTDPIEVSETSPCPEAGTYIKVPVDFNKGDRWFSLSGTITRVGDLRIDSMVTYMGLTFAIADTSRKGFFNRIMGRKDVSLLAMVDNPNVQITSMNNAIVSPKRKWYDRPLPAFAFGVLGGIIISRSMK